MKCPICKTELRHGQRSEFGQDAKNTYFCPKTDCDSFGMVWDNNGYIFHDNVFPNIKFIDDNPFALGSHARRESAKKKFPQRERVVFLFYPFQWKIETKYIIDDDGKLSDTVKTLKTLIKKKGYYQLWESPIKLFKRALNEFKENALKYKETDDEELEALLIDSFNPPKWDKRWGKSWASWWLKITRRKLLKKITRE